MSVGEGTPFGTLLKRYRMAARLTQEALAERAALSTRGISDLERGLSSTPRYETVVLLVTALGLAPQERALFEASAFRPAVDPCPPARAPDLAGSGPAAGGRPSLVGRTRELGLLQHHLVGDGPPVLLLAGEPGIGKSRLLREGAAQATGCGWTVLQGSCQRRGGQEPYAPLTGALERYLSGAEQAGDPMRLRAALRGCAWLVKLLPELTEGPIEPLPAWTVSPEQERRLVVQALGRFLANVAGSSGTLLVLDDLQWAGADALDLLALLARSPRVGRLRVLGAYRDSEVGPHDPLTAGLADLATQFPLGPLPPDDAAALLEQLLAETAARGPADDEQLRDRVLRRAGGMPFFLVSYAHALRGAGHGDGTTVPGIRDADGIPSDITQGVRRRVAALPPPARDLLGVAAIVGRAADYALLAAVTALPDAEAIAALDAACRARLLVDAGESYVVAHDVIREVVEADLGAARRTVFHRRVAEALARGPARAPAEVLAYHYGRGGILDTAVSYLEQAGDHARAQAAYAAAAGYYREAMDGLDTLGRTDDAVALRAKLGQVLLTQGRPEEALAVLEPAAMAARAAHDLDRLGAVTALMGEAHKDAGRGEEGLRHIEVTLVVLAPHGLSPGLAALCTAQAMLLSFLGRYREQLAAADRAVDLARRLGDPPLLAQAHWQRTRALFSVGPMEQWLRALEEMEQRAETAADVTILSHTLMGLCQAYLLSGEFDRSRAYNERAIAVAAQLGDSSLIWHRTCMRGFVAIYAGDWAQARVDIEWALAKSRAFNAPEAYGALHVLGTLCLVEGVWDEAARHLEEARDLTERASHHEGHAWAQRLLAELDLLEGRPAAARARLVALLESPTNDEHDHAFLLPSLAWASLQSGDADQASTVAATAVARARAEQNRLALADALRVDALVALMRQQWAVAMSSLDEGLAMTRQIRYPYAEGRLLHVYGLLHVQRKEPELARERLEAARAIFQELGAHKDTERALHIIAALPDETVLRSPCGR